jgi:hypothetical protein
MLTWCFRRNLRTVIWLSAIALIVLGTAITGLAVAKSPTTPLLAKTDCKAKAAKLMELMEANAPLYR